jgi:hypothetical protein
MYVLTVNNELGLGNAKSAPCTCGDSSCDFESLEKSLPTSAALRNHPVPMAAHTRSDAGYTHGSLTKVTKAMRRQSTFLNFRYSGNRVFHLSDLNETRIHS